MGHLCPFPVRDISPKIPRYQAVCGPGPAGPRQKVLPAAKKSKPRQEFPAAGSTPMEPPTTHPYPLVVRSDAANPTAAVVIPPRWGHMFRRSETYLMDSGSRPVCRLPQRR
ncbi:unnamed protein product [Calypogeia fissa]